MQPIDEMSYEEVREEMIDLLEIYSLSKEGPLALSCLEEVTERLRKLDAALTNILAAPRPQ